MTVRCRVCKSNKIKNLFLKKNFPYFSGPLESAKIKQLNKILKKKKKTNKLNVAFCEHCSHIFLQSLPSRSILSELYKKFYSYPSALKKGFEPTRDNEFLKIFNSEMRFIKGDRSILEIGCFDGYIINKLKKKFKNIFGCDPSPGAEIGKKRGLKIKKNFFSKDLYRKNFDIIIGRHIFEHLINLSKFLNDIKYKLNKKGILVLEVPNVDFFLNNGLLTIFSLQHIQYFNEASIKKVLDLNGFKINRIFKSQENLIVFCEKKIIEKNIKIKKNFKLIQNFNQKLKKNEKLLKNFLIKNNVKKKDIIVWGAGGAGIAILKFYNINHENVLCYVDIDKSKISSCYLNIRKKIFFPRKNLLSKAKFIFIASMYTENILAQINKMKIKKKIITFFPKFNILNN